MVDAVHLTKTYELKRSSLFEPRRRITAVDDVSFSVTTGASFGLVGESGSGKTTVAKMLLKLESPNGGELKVDGQNLTLQDKAQERAYRRTVQAVLQDPYGALSPRMRVGSIIAEPLLAQGGISRAEVAEKVQEILALVGLSPNAVHDYPHQFSGGQRQRIAIARAISVNPRVLVLDEPVSALDVSVRAQILHLLRDMQQKLGLTYLFIGHDLAVVRFMTTRVGVMYFGRLVETGPASGLFRTPLHPYTRRLVAIAAGRPLTAGGAFGGEMPNPLDPPSGCTYRTRCAYVTQRCIAEMPVLRHDSPEHAVACHYYETITSNGDILQPPTAGTLQLSHPKETT
jgi:oligopeptide/dipeptide ABC transporter ATP-binding protein